jgi:hypothetical protein
MKLSKDSVHWGKVDDTGSKYNDYLYYFYWFNWLPKKLRYVGYGVVYFDCMYHEHFGLWFFNLSWSTKIGNKFWHKHDKYRL